MKTNVVIETFKDLYDLIGSGEKLKIEKIFYDAKKDSIYYQQEIEIEELKENPYKGIWPDDTLESGKFYSISLKSGYDLSSPEFEIKNGFGKITAFMPFIFENIGWKNQEWKIHYKGEKVKVDEQFVYDAMAILYKIIRASIFTYDDFPFQSHSLPIKISNRSIKNGFFSLGDSE